MKAKIALLLWTLILSACSFGITTPQASPALNLTITTTQPPSDINPTIELPVTETEPPTPIITTDAPSPVNECGYEWAYEDLPELTAQFDQTVKNLISNSNSHATAFGENCIGSDGQIVRFLAMETDYYVIVSVEALNDYRTFGNWIAQVMQAVNGLPPDLVVGLKPGFVEFRLEKSMSESTGFRVPIQGYNEIADGKTGEELFRLFYTEP